MKKQFKERYAISFRKKEGREGGKKEGKKDRWF